MPTAAMPSDPILSPFREQRHNHRACVADALSAAEQICRRRKVRLTSARREVLALIWQSHAPIKAYDLLSALQKSHPGAAPPTVYRALDFLQQQGLVHRIESLNAFVGCGDPAVRHEGQFLICDQCGAVSELDDKEIRRVLGRTAAGAGFSMKSCTLEITGTCRACSRAN